VPTLPASAKDQPSEHGWPLRVTLLFWVTVALLPIALVSVLQGIERARLDAAEVHDRLIQSARAAASDEENLLTSAEQIARALSNLADVRGVTRNCSTVLGDALVGVKYFANISRLDANGMNVCAALPASIGKSVAAQPVFERARGADGFVVSGQIMSVVLHRPVIAGMLPMRDRTGKFEGALAIALEIHWLDLMVRAHDLPPGAVVFVYDGSGNLLAASNPSVARSLIDTAGKFEDSRQLLSGHDNGGRTWTIAAAQLRGSIINVAFAMPEQRLFLPTYLHVGVDFLMPLLMIGLAWAGIWFATERQVTQWIAYLRRISAAYRTGHYSIRPQLEDAPREFHALGQDLSEMASSIQDRDKSLRDAVAQKSLLIREIHHRVKNNLQIVMSLLSLQAGQLKDPTARDALMQAQVRINALALVHRILHEIDDQTTIDIKRLLHELTQQIAEGMRADKSVRIVENLVERDVPGDVAVPLALFAVEALTNIFKYAFPEGHDGVIHLSLTPVDENKLKLVIADNGVGFEDGKRPGGIGTRLIRTFGTQIGGTSNLSTIPGQGTTVEVTFRDPLAQAA